ncbi:MAG: dihydropteroate synthase [Chloroflexi bacterium]|nr:dihydropteroate synthase [Chloroflexota bacterium]
MLIVGEAINGTREKVGRAILARDDQFFRHLARSQIKRGAHMLDLNAGVSGGQEAEDLIWLVKVVQQETELPLLLDSSNAAALGAALAVFEGKPVINSITAEKKTLDPLLPVLAEHRCGVVALCLGEEGIPPTPDARLTVASDLVDRLSDVGVAPADIYVDPLILTVATRGEAGIVALKTLELVKKHLPQVQTIGGVSNVSFGLPHRGLLNRTFLAMALALGLDAAIVDVLDDSLMASLFAAEALLGTDKWCRRYLKAYRQGLLPA